MSAARIVENTADWENGLFGCFGDCGLCLVTSFLPCCTAGKNAQAVGKSCLVHSLLGLIPVVGCVCQSGVRRDIREQRSIDGSCCGDYLVHLLCGCCALIQEGRELKTPSPNAVGVVVDQPRGNEIRPN
ncbi:cornifelin homolog A-like [Saccoglossus kowalevskii]|uniref:Cell number regulator 13-like n=1 Tax=Saccoglossus kowalevskii TaxID=10224 RepID=A0ABM0MCP5_SACKO|nr:PREDICTED: cell number regulator 13-like [Saccoglossus kowalevskii]